jgi:CDP-diglyceride synthetase
MRTVLGVIVGYLIFGVSAFLIFRLTGHDPHLARERISTSFIIISIVVGIIAAIIGGYVAAVIARNRWAPKIVATVIILLAVVSVAYSNDKGVWSQVAAIVLMGPAANIGGALAKRRVQ